MEPVSIVTTVIGLYNFTLKVIDYMRDVKGAPTDRAKYVLEATMLSNLLSEFKDMLEEGSYTPSWLSAATKLACKDGPFEQLTSAPQEILDKLKTEGIKKIGQVILWNYVKDDISKAFMKIERIKSTIAFTISQENL